MKKTLVTTMAAMAFYFGAPAQNINTAKLIWTVSQLKDNNTNQQVAYSCTFTTNGSQAILWSQKNGAYMTALAVQGMSGAWANVSTTGKVVYQVSTSGQTGTLTFGRDVGGLFVAIDLYRPDGSRLNHHYSAASVN
jgi:hypothetical protein